MIAKLVPVDLFVGFRVLTRAVQSFCDSRSLEVWIRNVLSYATQISLDYDQLSVDVVLDAVEKLVGWFNENALQTQPDAQSSVSSLAEPTLPAFITTLSQVTARIWLSLEPGRDNESFIAYRILEVLYGYNIPTELRGGHGDRSQDVEALVRWIKPSEEAKDYRYYYNLGHVYASLSDQIKALSKSIECFVAALGTDEPGNWRDRVLNDIALSNGTLFRITGDLAHLDDGLGYSKRAIKYSKDDKVHDPEFFSHIVWLFVMEFETQGSVESLEEAIRVGKELCHGYQSKPRFYRPAAADLAAAFLRRFESSSTIQDLDDAIDLAHGTIQKWYNDDSCNSLLASHLSGMMLRKSEFRSNLEYLDLATDYGNTVLKRVKPKCYAYALAKNQLGITDFENLSSRQTRTLLMLR